MLDRINRVLGLGGLPAIEPSELPIFAANDIYAGFEYRVLTKYSAEYFGLSTLKGYLVADVYRNSVAEKAGLKPGDIILKINNLELPHVTTPTQLREIQGGLRPGEYVVAVVWRDRKEVTLSGIIERAPLEFMIRQTAFSLLTDRKAVRAVALLEPIARQGDSRAKSMLGTMYAVGNLVPKNLTLAVPLIRDAAEAGERWSAYLLGLGYLGGEGVSQNDAEAFRWLKFSADAGLHESMGALAILHFAGRGTSRDFVKAYQLANISANQGGVLGMWVLGVMHEQGAGVSKDFTLVRQWYQRAADLNFDAAKAALQRLAGR